MTVPRKPEPAAAPQPAEPESAAPQPGEPRSAGPQPGDPRPGEPRSAAPQPGEPRSAGPQPGEPRSAAPQPTVAQLAEGYAAKAGLHRSSNGNIDVLKSAGGVQGISESILPGLVFLVAFTVTRELSLALVCSLAVAAAFTVVRLVQRKPLTQALAGIIGVGISAWLASSTGKAEDFYVPGFITNFAYILAMSLSIAVRWPFAGLLFGFIRNEGLEWRKHPARVKAYRIGTWVIISVLALRLMVQLPLYFMGEPGFAALATTRLLMGAPLYILGIWVAWLLTRPAPAAAGTDQSS